MTLENLVRIHELKKEAADKREFDVWLMLLPIV